MGITGENAADKYGITREQQDAFAAASHNKTEDAVNAGRFDEETFTVEVPVRKKDPIQFSKDENFRAGMTAESISGMRAAFKKDGTVTAANASSINDGAAAVVVMSADKAKELGVKPLARITGYASGGTDPKWVMMAPMEAVKNLSKRTGEDVKNYDLVELNEAFSSQCVAVRRLWEVDPDKFNVNGGGVALGHPIGASGTRVLTTLIWALKNRGLENGMATLCLGGGGAVAMSVEVL